MSLHAALGRTLREPAVAKDAVPPFDNSGMDGYAVRYADCSTVPVALKIVETILAGSLPEKNVEPGSCAAIMTGAPLPPGADTIVQVEWTESAGPGLVRICRIPKKGQHIRLKGKDGKPGEHTVESGTVISPFVLGMLAAAGMENVAVGQLPRVTVVATGDELHTEGGLLPYGKIRDINGPALMAQVKTAGGQALGPYYVGDEASSILKTLSIACSGSDIVIVSGGVSMGQHDLVKDVLDDMGAEKKFWRVRQRPGGPMAFSMLGECAIFGLPGNPVSAAVCFDQYVRPYIGTMLQRSRTDRPRMTATLSKPISKKAGLHYFVRGTVRPTGSGQLTVCDSGPQASNQYSSLARANCIIHVAEDAGNLPSGTLVEIEPLRDIVI